MLKLEGWTKVIVETVFALGAGILVERITAKLKKARKEANIEESMISDLTVKEFTELLNRKGELEA